MVPVDGPAAAAVAVAAVKSDPRNEVEEEGDEFAVYCRRGKGRRRVEMEDRHVAKVALGGDPKVAFFAVFDGHGGNSAAEFAAENMPKFMADEMKKVGGGDNGEIEGAVKKGYLKTDEEFLKREESGGACCVTALLQKGGLTVSNTGDCRAVLSRAGKAEALTTDHRASREDEKERIENLVKESLKLRQIMQTILTLGNALNQGTARGSAVGFRLDSLLKLSDTRARNNKMTLMHYLCKLLAEKLPELLDFDKGLIHLEAASKIQLKLLAEEMQAINKGLEKVEQELAASVNDGAISIGFRKALKCFLDSAEAVVRSLISLYSEVGRNADSLAQYFGEDPARCPFEQVTSILVIFVNMFKKSRDENARTAEAEKKKMEKEKEKASISAK